MKPSQHPFSWQAIARIIVAGIAVFLIWKSIGIFVLIIVSLVIAVALYPIAQKMSRKMPMMLAAFVAIILLLIPFVILITVTSLTFTNQYPQVVSMLMPLLQRFNITPDFIANINVFGYIQGNFGVLVDSTKSAALAILSVLTTLFLAYYFIFDAERLFKLFVELFVPSQQKNIKNLFQEIGSVIGQYVRGNLFISLICILIIYAGLAILKIPFALPIAIFTGIMDLLPVVGPVLGAIPALVLGFLISPITGILVLVLYLVYKEFEDGILGPAIYNKALNLSAALIFLSVVIGAGVFGVVGAFLALPVAASIPVIIRYKENFMRKEESRDIIQ